MNRRTIFSLALVSVAAGALALGGAEARVMAAAPASDMTAPPNSPSAPNNISYNAYQVVKLYRGGIGKEVILSYINSSPIPYHLSADGILYLQSIGVPQDITQAMMTRDRELQQQSSEYVLQQQQQMQAAAAAQAQAAQQAQADQQAQGAQNQAAPSQNDQPMVTPTTPAPDVSDNGNDNGYYGGYPAYYGYPYSYPYNTYAGYYPYFGWYGYPFWGWGWGHGYHGAGFHGYYGPHGFVHGFSGPHGHVVVGGFHGGTGVHFHAGTGFHGGSGVHVHVGFSGGHGGGHH